MGCLGGIIVVLMTPFTDDKIKIDEFCLQNHIEHLIKAGVHGIVPGGSRGESTVMSTAERKQLTELCVRFSAGCIPVVLEQERFILSRLPVMFYNMLGASGLKLSPTEIAGLSKVGVKYLKDTSGNAPALTELVFGLSDQNTTFNGCDTLTFYGLAAGCQGGVWGAANFIPELAVELWDSVAVKGDLKRGRDIWAKTWPICNFLETHSYCSNVKTGVELTGQPTGGLRKPFSLLKPELQAELKQLLKNAAVRTI
ncbi:hypothetical protein AARAC_003111 [Aspergillus arachidicola]|uniref:Dihydrodipicolinate synthetase family protein n=1 Tax=Aspergillus arachidicola TaxID=656916 RepID=A0A2G7FSR0_9EURO|nr:hypothetical protein AARAC_003111 [Aspergillus arachidicola]